MRVLIDTHAFLWFCEGNPALSAAGRTVLENGENDRYVRLVTGWEIAIKTSLGKLKLQASYDDVFPGVLKATGFILLIPDFRHFSALLQMPFHHRDSFDRLLIAQAQTEGLTLLTQDPLFAKYGASVCW
jgi:PIN domain nuclease of toxin-antitoxin system